MSMTREDFDRLQESEELERTVPVPHWGDVRLVKLHGKDFLDVFSLQSSMEKNDEGTLLDNSDALTFSSCLLSKCIHTDAGERPFDSDEGRLFLIRQNINVLSLLTNEAIDLCGLGAGGIDGQIETAKKN